MTPCAIASSTGMYRDVADAAGVPGAVWYARARHGGGTEARASGTSIEDTTDPMQKSDMEGTRRDYMAGNVDTPAITEAGLDELDRSGA
ncbi:MAG: hypothetical protein JWR77_2653 [Rhizorhabdus sp.]|nr:hypothetical protein [Rhizorhabdus sp.]